MSKTKPRQPVLANRDDPESMSYAWRIVRESAKEKRTANTLSSTERLTQAGIAFESKNFGSHLVVSSAKGLIDFWPSTGLWIPRGTNHRRGGVSSLLQFCGVAK